MIIFAWCLIKACFVPSSTHALVTTPIKLNDRVSVTERGEKSDRECEAPKGSFFISTDLSRLETESRGEEKSDNLIIIRRWITLVRKFIFLLDYDRTQLEILISTY